jgi:uncharacterized protein YaiE (UPF0345 family)
MGTHFDHVSISKKANVFLNGKCISYNLDFPGHAHKTLGVILESPVTFRTEGPEIMEIVSGKCRARIGEEGEWKIYESGQRFRVPAHSRFDVEVQEPVHYVCHFAND